MISKFAAFVVAIALPWSAHAQDSPEVLLFGVFHFANPGLDVVQVDQIDVLASENQAYLDGLSERLCDFKPTTILLEFDAARDQEMTRRLGAYLSGKQDLAINETEQIGFRIAKACDVSEIHGFDEQEVHWRGDVLFEYLEYSEPEILDALNDAISQIQESEARAHAELGLRELLMRANDPALDRLNMDFYLMSNVAGAGSTFEGADATAGWWHRNFRMYANVQKHAKPGARILVIAGQGHTAILRLLLQIDRRIVARDVRAYL